jgi:hypothetical protein
MTEADDSADNATRSNGNPRYRNPPAKHRFRKGVSGNPNGRPSKKRALVATKVGGKPSVGLEDRIKLLAIEEAYRIITIREGDREDRVPVIQAILRKVAVAAANGNTRAQQYFLNLVIGAEADRRAAAMELLMHAVEHKERLHSILAERARTGATGPEPTLHPDEIKIDPDTGEVRIEGPVLQEQKAAQDALRAMWPDLEQSLTTIEKDLESHPNDPSLRERHRELTKTISWLRADALKRKTREIMMPGKSKKN